MKLRLGGIGEKNVLAIIREVIAEYPDFEYMPFLCSKNTAAMEQIISDNQDAADVWLVFGQLDYQRIKNKLTTLKNLYYVPYRGASAYKVLCNIFYQGYKADDISFDTITRSDIERGFKEMAIPFQHITCLETSVNDTLQDYIAFHKKQLASQKAKVVVTTSLAVQQQLQSDGIKAWCILPVRVSIRTVLNMILSDYRISQLHNSQIAVQFFDFDLYKCEDSFYVTTDDIYSRELNITQALLRYTKNIQGSLKAAGQGKFFIFTTRGLLDERTQGFQNIIADENLQNINSELLACGIGLGTSANEAEINAMLALQHSKNAGAGCWYVVMDDKTISGPLGNANALTFSYDFEKLHSLSKKTGLTVATLNKIISLEKKLASKPVSARDLAAMLHILPRSARRLIATLVKHSIAVETGTETPALRGRPYKLYRFEF